MAVFLVNPSDHSFGTAVITPRWLYVLAAATPPSFGDPVIVDETLEPLVPSEIKSGDFVGIGIHNRQCPARLRGRTPGARARRVGGVWRHPRHALPRRSPGARPCALCGQGRRRRHLVQGVERLCPRATGADLRRRQDRCRSVCCSVGPAAGEQVYVGLRADGARLP